MTTTRLNFNWLRGRDAVREAAMAWVRANDLNPNDIPIDADFLIDRKARTITVDVVDKDEDGKARFSKYEANAIALKQITVPLLAEWDERLTPDQP